MSGGNASNHCKGSSAFTFDAHMSGNASVDASGAHTGDNTCKQGADAKGGSGSLGVTVPALLNLQSGTILINPTMTGSSSFTGHGPMVSGSNNHFGLQNLQYCASMQHGIPCNPTPGVVYL